MTFLFIKLYCESQKLLKGRNTLKLAYLTLLQNIPN